MALCCRQVHGLLTTPLWYLFDDSRVSPMGTNFERALGAVQAVVINKDGNALSTFDAYMMLYVRDKSNEKNK